MGSLIYGLITCITPIAIISILLRALLRPSKGAKNVKNNKIRNKDTVGINVSALEDRKSDWLAGQLNTERQARYSTSEMFNLKLEHEDNCAAKENRDLHQNYCDANGIDTGASR